LGIFAALDCLYQVFFFVVDDFLGENSKRDLHFVEEGVLEKNF